MSYELIALSMFGMMMVMLLTGQRVFAAIGFVASAAALLLYGEGAVEMPFSQVFKLFNWFPMLTLPLFIYMGYILSSPALRKTSTACCTSGSAGSAAVLPSARSCSWW